MTQGLAPPAGEQPPVAAPRPRVLVVDDSPDMRALLAEVLEVAGYDVVRAASGARALAEMNVRVPDLVITDLLMPGMTGFTLRATMLRNERLAAVPVIVLSAYWRRPSDTLEASDVLSKPLNIDRLLEAVARLTGPARTPG
ncbi:MAG TPA: response regulator [Candidatus Limnocylindria bacterium]|nr:response regulator [Candidatus Limnocylindria bacterium]